MSRGAPKEFVLYHVDAHIRKMNLLVVYTNDTFMVENSINTMGQLFAEGDKYKVVGFDHEYTVSRARYDQNIVVAQLSVCHHFLVYHYCMDTTACECFSELVNNPD
ncbi:hypothetical protein D1007_20442 [Hordeum vulgare]|nr:hypothetical protein D1007_20442 [Hordeum vulgare]